MQAPAERADFTWPERSLYPRPDYLSSSRKRLAPQMLFKGGILNAWGKKQAVALHRTFFETLPPLPQTAPEDAQIAWLIYDLAYEPQTQRRRLVRWETIYTRFEPALLRITTPEIGPVTTFIDHLQSRLDLKRFGGSAPDAPLLTDLDEV